MNQLPIRKILRIIIASGVVALAAIQLVPVDRVNPPIESEISVPAEVRVVLRKACYDCHSNETIWPWYSKIAPISWLVASDVHEGREELNFSTWARYDNARQIKKLKESWEEIEEGEMPPWIYIIMHKEAAMSPAERELLHKWILDLIAK